MYVCVCNPFTDKDVQKALNNPDVRNTPAQVYKCCSGGLKPGCGSCICDIKDMIVDHQSKLGVQKIIEDMPELAETDLETAE